MSNYTKPTIVLLNAGTSTAAASSCSTDTNDAKEIMDILKEMGYSQENAFGIVEACVEIVPIEDYCKFSSAITIFFS